ncbi:FG-GAP repeat protein [Planctomycetota bacterium]|nr:FG-GAP repeat protein [Planctomycetota bacterium]
MNNFSTAAIALAFVTTSVMSSNLFASTARETNLNLPGIKHADLFGTDVSLNSTMTVIGAPGRSYPDFESGTAFIFDMKGNYVKNLRANDSYSVSNFGEAIAINDQHIVVGAPMTEDHMSFPGAVYVFDTQGIQKRKLTASDKDSHAQFGAAVDLYNNHVIVGSPFKEVNDETWAGAAYIYDVNTGQQKFRITADDYNETDHFGNAVAISSNTALIGAYSHEHRGDDSGAAYLFDMQTGKQEKLIPTDNLEDDQFGYSVALSEEYALIGAPGADINDEDDAGSVYVYDHQGTFINKLIADDGDFIDHFGYSVAISGDTAIIGAYFDDNEFLFQHGSAYLFDIPSGKQIRKIVSKDESASFFGRAVDIHGENFVIGSTNSSADDTIFSSYLYTVPEPTSLALLSLSSLVLLTRKRH